MARTVLLVVNRSKPEASAAAAEVRALVERSGRLVAERDSSAESQHVPEAELVVVLGGDGTLLGQSRRLAALDIPVLGVNFGKLGFMAEFDMEALRKHAAGIFSGASLKLRELPLLGVRITPADSRMHRFEGLCLNEAVVTAGPPYRMITLSMSIDGRPGPEISGDGLIVCTPQGSTAYNLSAGGPIVAPGVEAMIITPIAAHTLSFRPIAVPLSAKVELDLKRANAPSAGGGGTTLVLDGQVQEPLARGDRISIGRHGRAVRFVQNPDHVYWSALTTKLHWAASPLARE